MNHPRSITSLEALERRRLLSATWIASFRGSVPSALAPGATGHVIVAARETGLAPASDTITAALYASPEPTLGADATSLGELSRSVGRGTRALAFNFRFSDPGTLPDGSYYLIATVASASAMTNPGVAASAHPVSLVQPVVDVAGSIVAQPVYPVLMVGRRAGMGTARVALFNAGNVPASGAVNVTLYASSDGMIDASSQVIGTGRALRVAAGKSKVVTVRLSVPYSVAAGSYTLLAQVNPPGGAARKSAVAVAPNPLVVTNTLPVFMVIRHHRECYYGEDNGQWIDYGDDAAAAGLASGLGALDTTDQAPSDLGAAVPSTNPTTSPTTDPTTGSDSSGSTPADTGGSNSIGSSSSSDSSSSGDSSGISSGDSSGGNSGDSSGGGGGDSGGDGGGDF